MSVNPCISSPSAHMPRLTAHIRGVSSTFPHSHIEYLVYLVLFALALLCFAFLYLSTLRSARASLLSSHSASTEYLKY